MRFCVSFVFLLYSSGPCYCTYTHAWHLVMSLHERCVTQHPDSLGKITPVSGREKLSLPEVLDFPFCYLLSVGEFSCGQHGYNAPAICPQTDLLAAKQPAPVHTLKISLLLSQFPLCSLTMSFVPAFLTLYLISSVSIPVSTLHLLLLLSSPLSLSVRGLMWDCKWSSLTSISGYQGSICVAQYQAGHSASLTLSQGRTGRQMKLLTHKHGARPP